jgi:DNA end-binding protein Ku
MARPYWSGQLRISLVSFGIQLFPATEVKSEIRFHQLNRRTGERVKYQKTSGEEGPPIEKDEIVKGYEYNKGDYVMIEPGDIENLRIPSRQTLDVTQFVDRDEVDPEYYEKPYFVTPQNASQAEAFTVVRKALQATKKMALGKIAFGGREHLMAIAAPDDDEQLGMMAYTLRYAEELRKPEQYFNEIKSVAIDADQLELATELIKRKAGKFNPEQFKDEYEHAVREMVEAKVKHAPPPKLDPTPKPTNVVNLMDALRKSLSGDIEKDGAAREARTRVSRTGKTLQDAPIAKKGPKRIGVGDEPKIALVKSTAKSARSGKRKSA